MSQYSSSEFYNSLNSNKLFNMIDNYIYMHHLNTYIILPLYPQSVRDSQQANFAPSTPLMRSAPIQSFQGSSARSITFEFQLHREYMSQLNYKKSNAKLDIGDDYVDTLIKDIQACALPKYDSSEKMVDPPIVSVRLGDDIFIKGVVKGPPTVLYQLPIINIDGKDKYALVSISFSVDEIDPYSADDIVKIGSFRGLSTSLERNIWKTSNSLSSKISKIRG